MTPAVRAVVARMPDKAAALYPPEKFMWFDLVEPAARDARAYRSTNDDEEYDAIMKTPFQNCMLVYQDADEQHVIALEQVGTKLKGTFFNDARGCIEVVVYPVPEGSAYATRFNFDGVDMGMSESAEVYANDRVWNGLCELHTRCTTQVMRPGVLIPNRANSKRTAKGKNPLYDWHTVVLEPQKPKQEAKGGTHASPRPHDVRGHFKTSKLGKRYWCEPFKRGKGPGFIFKDYTTKPRKPRKQKEKTT